MSLFSWIGDKISDIQDWSTNVSDKFNNWFSGVQDWSNNTSDNVNNWLSGVPGAIQDSGWLSSSAKQNEYNREFNSAENAINRAFQHDEAAIQRKWLEDMSNSAYQRSMEDMRKAGLNPILAFSNGGASSVGAGLPTSSAASINNSGGESLSAFLSSASSIATALAKIKSVFSKSE